MQLRYFRVLVGFLGLVACTNSVGGNALGTDEQGQEIEQPGGGNAPLGTPDIVIRHGDVVIAPNTTSTFELGRTRPGAFVPSITLTVENPGTAPVTLVTNGGGSFSAAHPTRVAAGATDTIELLLEPTSAGTYNGTIELTTSVPSKAYAFDLTGIVLPGNVVPLNPYYTTAPWKLWFVDPTPVEYSGINSTGGTTTATHAPPDAATRKFPTAAALAATWPAQFLGLELAPTSPAAAGWWDDVSASIDNGHTGPLTGWGGTGGNTINLSGQFIRVGYGGAYVTQRQSMGYNFTSESYAQRGAFLSRVNSNVVSTERDWMFTNTIRGTPSYYSFNDHDPVYTSDNYDGLYGIGYHSLGRSGSETHALLKMLIAGGFMPRATKELLKRHGLYATTMLTLFRQALPYVNADGSPVEYEGEMIQRPTYLSKGDGTSEEFALQNIVYHQYDDTRHLYGMIQGAKALTTPPPVAVMNLVSVKSVIADGEPVVWANNDPRIHVRGKTTTTIWADPADNLEIRVDMGESLDLAGGAIDLSADAVYPNQASALSIEREGDTAIFKIRATYDANLPLGRVPVILQATARGLRSNPTFLNIYWRQADQADKPGGYFDANTSDRRDAVFWNARPTLTTSLGAATTVAGSVGSPTSFTVTCVDPEGFATRIYRRAEDSGTFVNGTYTMTPTRAGNFPVSIICSDGTGAFNSTRITVEVP